MILIISLSSRHYRAVTNAPWTRLINSPIMNSQRLHRSRGQLKSINQLVARPIVSGRLSRGRSLFEVS